MNTISCYRLLGLSSSASLSEVKLAYRRLARAYHPDFNQGDESASLHFIRLTKAYKHLLMLYPEASQPKKEKTEEGCSQPSKSAESAPKTTPMAKPRPVTAIPYLSEVEHRLKWDTYEKLQGFLREKRFARAIALVEGLAYRIPYDAEVRQWQSVVYQQAGRCYRLDGEREKAKKYLRKALITDPHNRSLVQDVKLDLMQLGIVCS